VAEKLRVYTAAAVTLMTQLRAAGFSSNAQLNSHSDEWKWTLTSGEGTRFRGKSDNVRQGGLEPFEVAFWHAVENAQKLGAIHVKDASH